MVTLVTIRKLNKSNLGGVLMYRVLALTVWAISGYALHKNFCVAREKQMQSFNFTKSVQEINELHATAEKLSEVEELITQLSICNPDERATAIQLSYNAIDGNHTIDLLCTGTDDTSINLLNTALAERQRLRYTLQQQTKKLNTVVTETVTETLE